MTTKQISVFLENRPNSMAEVSKLLDENKINLRALSLADTQDFGILRIIVDDCDFAAKTLKNSGYVLAITQLLTIEISDIPGSFYKAVKLLGENNINIEYVYASTANNGHAFVFLRVNDTEKAVKIIQDNNITLYGQEDLLRIFE